MCFQNYPLIPPSLMRLLKSSMLVAAGCCWLAAGIFLVLFLYQYLVGGAGLQVFGFFFSVSSLTVAVGLVHLVGFAFAAGLCFLIGMELCVHGLVPAPASPAEAKVQNRSH